MLVAQGTNRLDNYSLQNVCKRLVSAIGNCFPELVHIGCAWLSYDMGEPQVAHTRQILPNKTHGSDNFNVHSKTRYECQG